MVPSLNNKMYITLLSAGLDQAVVVMNEDKRDRSGDYGYASKAKYCTVTLCTPVRYAQIR